MSDAKEDFNEVWAARPAAPVGDKAVEVHVVAKRCVYINDRRIAGGKPYASENLPSHNLKTSLAEIIEAFPEEDILEALAERRKRKEYFAAYHARRAASETAGAQ